jgi:hypothetical protein
MMNSRLFSSVFAVVLLSICDMGKKMLFGNCCDWVPVPRKEAGQLKFVDHFGKNVFSVYRENRLRQVYAITSVLFLRKERLAVRWIGSGLSDNDTWRGT